MSGREFDSTLQPGILLPRCIQSPIVRRPWLLNWIRCGLISYEWRDPDNNVVGTGATLEIPNVTSSMTGVYTVFLTDEFGCEIFADKGVEILPGDISDAGPDQLLCNQTETNLDANVPQFGTGLWMILSGNANLLKPGDPNTLVPADWNRWKCISRTHYLQHWIVRTWVRQFQYIDGNQDPEIIQPHHFVKKILQLGVLQSPNYTSSSMGSTSGIWSGQFRSNKQLRMSKPLRAYYFVYVTDRYGCEMFDT